jgi:hypothetical protein
MGFVIEESIVVAENAPTFCKNRRRLFDGIEICFYKCNKVSRKEYTKVSLSRKRTLRLLNKSLPSLREIKS